MRRVLRDLPAPALPLCGDGHRFDVFHVEFGADRLPNNVLLTVMASSLYRLLGAKLGAGCEIAKSKHLFRDFVNATGHVAITHKEITLCVQKRAHNPYLIAAGLHYTDIAIPWLAGKRLRLDIGQRIPRCKSKN